MVDIVRADQGRSVQSYKAWDGNEVKLTLTDVLDTIVRGRKEYVTQKEVVLFMELCKSQKANPFVGDMFLIKYTANDPAQMVTSIEYARLRARAQDDCTGWECGIIVEDKDGNEKRTHGLFREGETLLGGWFKATPKGWTTTFTWEVNLNQYIKRKQDGSITQFWTPEKQPHMIRKIAEFQGLKALWPKLFKGLYEQDELPQAGETIVGEVSTVIPEIVPEPGEDIDDSKSLTPGEIEANFKKAIPKFTSHDKLEAFVKVLATKRSVSPTVIKANALRKWDEFITKFNEWIDVEKDKKGAPNNDAQKATTKAFKSTGEQNKTPEKQKEKPKVALDEALFEVEKFMVYPDQILVIQELMRKADFSRDNLEKPLDKFTEEERLELYVHLKDEVIPFLLKSEDVKCPNGDVMLLSYCDNVCTKQATCAVRTERLKNG